MDNLLTWIPTVIGFTTTVVGVVLTARSTALKTSIDNYKDLADSYKAKLEEQQEQLDKMIGKLTALETRINEVEKIPLQQISKHLGSIDESVAVLLTNQVSVSEKIEAIYNKPARAPRTRAKKQ